QDPTLPPCACCARCATFEREKAKILDSIARLRDDMEREEKEREEMERKKEQEQAVRNGVSGHDSVDFVNPVQYNNAHPFDSSSDSHGIHFSSLSISDPSASHLTLMFIIVCSIVFAIVYAIVDTLVLPYLLDDFMSDSELLGMSSLPMCFDNNHI
ncbi:hypothetical protein ADUPG1_013276, partial [Aduncisulcus paluster]